MDNKHLGTETSRGATEVVLAGDVVLRPASLYTPAVHSLLRHLEAVGYQGAPRVVGDGLTADGREEVTYISGSSPHPKAWDDDALPRIGALLRGLHDATKGFSPPHDAVWAPWFARELVGRHPVIGHCDCGPWNVVARDGVPVAFIDWEFAGPTDAIWEVAHATWLNAQLHDDDIAELHGLPPADQRAAQAGLLLDGYGLRRSERLDFVDKLIAVAVHSARAEAIMGRVTQDSTEAVDENGFPVLWAITWRARSASWISRHRQLLERAIT